MTKIAISHKEAFFREFLIPAGQAAEVFVHCFGDRHQSQISQILFENLGLASAFAISPATPDSGKIFKPMGKAIQDIIDLLKHDLAQFNIDGAKGDFAVQRQNARTFNDRMLPLVKNLHSLMGYAPQTQEKWMQKIMKVETPLTRNGHYNKWRTFVRHIDFSDNMDKLGLAVAAKKVGKLGSEQGREMAPVLWRECFDTNWDGTQFAPAKRPALPARATVKSNDTGMLDVAMTFEARKYLKKRLVGISKLPKDIDEALNVVQFASTCDYTQLPAAVEEMLAWEQAQMVKADELMTKIESVRETERVEALQKKLRDTFSPEDLELLEKVKAFPPAKRARAKPKNAAAKTA
jgi:hypothetical protein